MSIKTEDNWDCQFIMDFVLNEDGRVYSDNGFNVKSDIKDIWDWFKNKEDILSKDEEDKACEIKYIIKICCKIFLLISKAKLMITDEGEEELNEGIKKIDSALNQLEGSDIPFNLIDMGLSECKTSCPRNAIRLIVNVKHLKKDYINVESIYMYGDDILSNEYARENNIPEKKILNQYLLFKKVSDFLKKHLYDQENITDYNVIDVTWPNDAPKTIH